ncbi:DUF7619 domain-containing protein [Flavobacterium sp. UBA7682]|uniref:DUF7619 domain-containing protein n=1 Tax=Flavobacterium sp. UBA7682 TaxID=1946560 RepID=UPI0025C42B81|nr:T9SS type A sorting domain-containing protein [Flavobacterium sp. UBA7682]
MKKIYTLLVLLFAVSIANSQIVNIPDANFKAKLLAAGPNNTIASTQTPIYYPIIAWSLASSSSVDTNGDGEIQVSEAQAIKWLDVKSSNISSLTGIEAFNNLIYLDCSYNQLSSLNVSNLTNLNNLNCRYNQLQSLLNISNCISLIQLACDNNQLMSFDVNNLTNLKNLFCFENQLSNLDVSTLTSLNNLGCSDNQLTLLNIKNNNSSWLNLGFDYNPNLLYVCADEQDLSFVQQKISSYGYTNCHVNSYCSFTPNGLYYTIQGNSKFDMDNNGCEINDIVVPNLKIAITNGSFTGNIIANATGNYAIPMQAGNHILTPQLENPTYFNISPSSSTVTFPTSASPFVQNFCVTPNGTHNDLEVIILPIGPTRPGFDSQYKIIYKNKGNTTQSGSISMYYDDTILQLVTANPSTSSQGADLLSWNFNNLLPFESREISVILNLNSPLETPPVNAGNGLLFSATAVGDTDETPEDNTANLNQTVVNSFDPNDKTCIQGTWLPLEFVGEYVHYIIRFENNGTFAAENVVVKDIIDLTKFDMATLVPLSGSHSFVTRIINTNQVEFIFENINLPFDDANNDGYVAFKIKTKTTFLDLETFSNAASIYFDYNAPIVTETYTTTFYNPLNNSDFSFTTLYSLSPVPTKNVLNITAKESVVMTSVNIYNTLGQLVQVNTDPNETIDVSGLQRGSYFIKIISDRGSATGKFIKE